MRTPQREQYQRTGKARKRIKLRGSLTGVDSALHSLQQRQSFAIDLQLGTSKLLYKETHREKGRRFNGQSDFDKSAMKSRKGQAWREMELQHTAHVRKWMSIGQN